jgi:hypothetical protein
MNQRFDSAEQDGWCGPAFSPAHISLSLSDLDPLCRSYFSASFRSASRMG